MKPFLLVSLCLGLVVCLLFYQTSCQHEPILPDINKNPIIITSCDSNIIYFENQVLPILQSSCAYSKCHDASSHKEGIVLDNYSNLISSDLIHKNNALDSKIFEVITDPGEDRMPPSPKPALTSKQIEIIRKWIDQGAINNRCDACDTVNVHFSSTIWPIIQNSCTGCHSGTTPSKGIRLENYSNVNTIVQNGKLMGVINATGYVQMPPSGKLSDCKITQITKWKDNGAKND
jgi:hypothetical protein